MAKKSGGGSTFVSIPIVDITEGLGKRGILNMDGLLYLENSDHVLVGSSFQNFLIIPLSSLQNDEKLLMRNYDFAEQAEQVKAQIQKEQDEEN